MLIPPGFSTRLASLETNSKSTMVRVMQKAYSNNKASKNYPRKGNADVHHDAKRKLIEKSLLLVLFLNSSHSRF